MVGRVLEVILENFKSYEGRVRVGPFRKFTCVVGPNGAGKSNLMDAISFVLGIRPRQLRADRLQDVIHRKEGESPDEVTRTASVELVYEAGGSGEGGAEAHERTVFRREVQPQGEARFQVNGEGLSQAAYISRLEGVNILSEAKNFLVFQGDVETAANRQGKDLTTFFEQVSGSIAFREEYERLAVEKAQKEDRARHLYTKKRNAINEKKRVTQQKEEAERYQALALERRQLQVEFYLFRFHCLQCQAEDANRLQDEAEEERGEVDALVAARKEELGAAEQGHEQARLASADAERALAAARTRIDGLHPERVQVRSRLSVLEEQLQELRLQGQKEARKRGQLEAQIAAAREERRALEAELPGLSEQARRESPFTPEQWQEFQQAKQAAQEQASETSAQVQRLEAQLSEAVDGRARLLSEGRDTAARCSSLRRQINDLVEAESEARAVHERAVGEAQAAAAQLEEVLRNSQGQSQERKQLHDERQQIHREIQDITATERQIEYERGLAQVSADLAQLVPGVHGRVLELCSPSQRRFRVAVNVALGGAVDAVVTDTAEGARHCVRHLKERMLNPLTFLPLDSLRVPPPDRQLQEALRDRPDLRPALSCLSYDERFTRALEFLLGDVVIADNLELGKEFVFRELRQKGIGCRLVTLDGETISRDGNLAVSSEAAQEGATRFDFAALEATRGRLEAIDRRLYELDSHGFVSDVGTAKRQDGVNSLEAQAREREQSLDECRADLATRREELAKAEAEAARLQQEAGRLEQDEVRLRAEQRRLEESAGAELAVHFAQLGAAMGVEDVRRLEREWRQAREAAEAREYEVSQQLEGAKRELELLERKLQERSGQDPLQPAAECEAEIQSLRSQQERLAQEVEALQADVEAMKARLQECQASEREQDQAVACGRVALREQQQLAAEVQRRITGLASELQTLRDSRAELLRQSVLENVGVPLAGEGVQALQDAAAAAVGRAIPAESEAVDRAADLAVDFSSLPAEKRAVTGGPAAKLLEKEYRSELQRLAGELQRLQPNLKAIRQLADISQQAEEATTDAVAARRGIEDVDSRFNAVRKARRERFMACFCQVQEEINVVYKRLTGDATGRGFVGGSAFLDLEDLEDPFNGGVKFTAMPPMKRFCDISLLSGGERALAAMALLFAVQAYQRPPFLVLDEVDAHLDAGNLQALAKYVEQSDCQMIVISLKDKFFSRSEGLVGVTKDRKADTSVVLTWDLAQFRQAQAAAVGRVAAEPLPLQDEDVEME